MPALQAGDTECVYGVNLFKDIFAAIGDVVRGRSRTAERVFKEARTAAADDLRVKALQLGAAAIVGMHVQYSELTGGGKNGMLLAIATDTAVRPSQ
ncbi:heavy metal-binding domain-containing protein [Noviherbaspirillum malthae]|uniref:heavy metal-binding domain-containing protein n=1 Tax=Noviherbaspirillum malthae TaxID=1260987 RepID=UPI001E457D3F|nr:heavy metal-binding domain-containing protein [Noviherbaspirillum malthae]